MFLIGPKIYSFYCLYVKTIFGPIRILDLEMVKQSAEQNYHFFHDKYLNFQKDINNYFRFSILNL